MEKVEYRIDFDKLQNLYTLQSVVGGKYVNFVASSECRDAVENLKIHLGKHDANS